MRYRAAYTYLTEGNPLTTNLVKSLKRNCPIVSFRKEINKKRTKLRTASQKKRPIWTA